MKLIRNKKNFLEKEAAKIIAEEIAELLREKEKVVLAIPGGRSVIGIFNFLKHQDILWKRVHIFMIDERLVRLDHLESNFRLAKETFIEELIRKNLLPSENVHPLICDESSQDLCVKKYEDELKKHSDSYDIILVSAGEDGHIASLFPNHDSIKNNSNFFIKITDSPKLPSNRISASRNLLMKAKTALLLIIGEDKRKAYKMFLDNKSTYQKCPAKIIKEIPNSYVLTDL